MNDRNFSGDDRWKTLNNNRQSAEKKDSSGWNSSPIRPRERCLVCVEIRPFELEGGSFSRCLPPPDRCALLCGYDRRRLHQWQELVGFVEARTIEDRSSSDVARRSANRRPSSQLLKKKSFTLLNKNVKKEFYKRFVFFSLKLFSPRNVGEERR